MNKETIEFLYSGWQPFETFFGGLKDWQYNLAIKWVSENIEFYEIVNIINLTAPPAITNVNSRNPLYQINNCDVIIYFGCKL